MKIICYNISDISISDDIKNLNATGIDERKKSKDKNKNAAQETSF